MSIGFFLDENEPVMWRGPMLHRALEQFLSDVHWGELDTLLVDMPPGTGDVSISLGQLLPRAEVVVVTTRPGAAGRRSGRADGSRDEHAPRRRSREHVVLVGSGEEIFGSGGGEALAAELDIPLLGKIPLDPRLREARTAASRSSGPSRTPRRRSRSSDSRRRSPPRREEGLGIVKPLPVVGALELARCGPGRRPAARRARVRQAPLHGPGRALPRGGAAREAGPALPGRVVGDAGRGSRSRAGAARRGRGLRALEQETARSAT